MTKPFDDELQQRIARRAQRDGVTIAAAESLTGGLLADALATSPDAGEWLRGGIVAYSTDVKRGLLGVAGPVISAACATRMAEACRELLGADVGVGVTGVGGPERQEGEPVGTVFIACETHATSTVEQHAFDGEAAEIVAATVQHALQQLLRTLERPEAARRG